MGTNKKPMKAPNGAGTVYKLSGRRRNPWVARITTGWTDEGKRLYQTIGYFSTKKDGLDALTLNRITPQSSQSDITLKEIYDEWSKLKYEKISRATEDNYKAAWKYISRLSKSKFKDLRTNHWQSIIDECDKSGLSKSTLNKIKVVITMLYKYAIQNDIVVNNKNYGEFIVLPKKDKKEKNIFTNEHIETMFAKVSKVEWIDTILIMIFTGMRITELLTLTQPNIDLELKIITGGTKTDAGKNRIIPIHSDILSFIGKWYKKNGETLICKEDGKKMSPKYYRERKYYPALEKLNLPKLNPHSCRHKFASMMAESKVDTLYIQKLIGHTKYAFTADEYTHTDIESLRKAIDQIKIC